MTELTNLKDIKFITKEVEVLDGQYFAVKCVEIEDLLEVFGLSKEDIDNAVLTLDTSSKIRFLVTLLQSLPQFIDKIIAQCVVNYDDLDMIHNVLKIMKTERKLNLYVAIFDLSWDGIKEFLEQMDTAQGKVELILKFGKELALYESLK